MLLANRLKTQPVSPPPNGSPANSSMVVGSSPDPKYPVYKCFNGEIINSSSINVWQANTPAWIQWDFNELCDSTA